MCVCVCVCWGGERGGPHKARGLGNSLVSPMVNPALKGREQTDRIMKGPDLEDEEDVPKDAME